MEVIKLYKKDTKGRIRILKITVVGANLIQESGLLLGTLSVSTRVCKPKNIGKVNETSPHSQAVFEAKAIETKKLKEGYFRTIEEAENHINLMPMLATKADLSKIEYPVYVQPKLDGVRAVGTTSSLLSRKNRELDNVGHINLSKLTIEDIIDGEIYAHGKTFQENIKLIKKYREGETEEIKYHVYDYPSYKGGFLERITALDKLLTENDLPNVYIVPTYEARSEEEVLEFHTKFLDNGFEGTIIRTSCDTPYEFNKRSKTLMKLKDFIDEAYEIIDVVPMDKRPEQGKVVCRMPDGQTFEATPAMTHEDRIELLKNKEDIIGKKAEIRFFEYTDGGLPRFPVFHGVRLDK